MAIIPTTPHEIRRNTMKQMIRVCQSIIKKLEVNDTEISIECELQYLNSLVKQTNMVSV